MDSGHYYENFLNWKNLRFSLYSSKDLIKPRGSFNATTKHWNGIGALKIMNTLFKTILFTLAFANNTFCAESGFTNFTWQEDNYHGIPGVLVYLTPNKYETTNGRIFLPKNPSDKIYVHTWDPLHTGHRDGNCFLVTTAASSYISKLKGSSITPDELLEQLQKVS